MSTRHNSRHEFTRSYRGMYDTKNDLPTTLRTQMVELLNTRLADELTAVAAYSDDLVRAEIRDSLRACWAEPDTGWLTLDNLGPRIAAVFEHQGHQLLFVGIFLRDGDQPLLRKHEADRAL